LRRGFHEVVVIGQDRLQSFTGSKNDAVVVGTAEHFIRRTCVENHEIGGAFGQLKPSNPPIFDGFGRHQCGSIATPDQSTSSRRADGMEVAVRSIDGACMNEPLCVPKTSSVLIS
jgi:hypothetical protein